MKNVHHYIEDVIRNTIKETKNTTLCAPIKDDINKSKKRVF